MLDLAISNLKANGQSIEASLSSVSKMQARWRPEESQWSILEVINHLYDEEQFDFRARLRSLLEYPDKAWEPIDPQAWVSERKYNERNLAESVQNFLKERQQSLEWLASLNHPDLETPYIKPHPDFGIFRAKDLLASWLAHDLLHLRQITRLKYQYFVRDYKISYAGNW